MTKIVVRRVSERAREREQERKRAFSSAALFVRVYLLGLGLYGNWVRARTCHMPLGFMCRCSKKRTMNKFFFFFLFNDFISFWWNMQSSHVFIVVVVSIFSILFMFLLTIRI